jgi:hypothetical protein
MNQAHVKGKMRNRLKRLRKKTPEAPADLQGRMTDRIRELEALLSRR